jgi:hypothetical protein
LGVLFFLLGVLAAYDGAALAASIQGLFGALMTAAAVWDCAAATASWWDAAARLEAEAGEVGPVERATSRFAASEGRVAPAS